MVFVYSLRTSTPLLIAANMQEPYSALELIHALHLDGGIPSVWKTVFGLLTHKSHWLCFQACLIEDTDVASFQ